MIDRRAFLCSSAYAVLIAPLGVEAQQTGKMWRIGYLDFGSGASDRPYLEAFRRGLRELGLAEGQNITIEARFAEGKADLLPTLAAELVRLRMDVIATWGTPAALAAKHATTTIPIVIGFTGDPVGSGIVGSLARPGGNITGWTGVGLVLREKMLELLKEAIPKATRFGVLWNPSNQVHKPSLNIIESAAQRLKLELHLAAVKDARDLEPTFSTLVDKRVEALIVFPDGMFLAQKPLILALATRSRLPTMSGVREYVEAGGLMAYGANPADMERRIGASYVDKILKGAKPVDLPVEQPTKYDLVINLKTAKSLGLTIPQSLLLRADEVIE